MTIQIAGYLIQAHTTDWIDERARLGFSQARIAALLGCTQQAVARWESSPVICFQLTTEQYSRLVGAGFNFNPSPK